MDNSELPAIRGSGSRESLTADDRDALAASSADGDKVAPFSIRVRVRCEVTVRSRSRRQA